MWDANEDGVVSGNELSKVFTLFIGDDLSDEDAFKVCTAAALAEKCIKQHTI